MAEHRDRPCWPTLPTASAQGERTWATMASAGLRPVNCSRASSDAVLQQHGSRGVNGSSSGTRRSADTRDSRQLKAGRQCSHWQQRAASAVAATADMQLNESRVCSATAATSAAAEAELQGAKRTCTSTMLRSTLTRSAGPPSAGTWRGYHTASGPCTAASQTAG